MDVRLAKVGNDQTHSADSDNIRRAGCQTIVEHCITVRALCRVTGLYLSVSPFVQGQSGVARFDDVGHFMSRLVGVVCIANEDFDVVEVGKLRVWGGGDGWDRCHESQQADEE